ncbi:stage II sporulation protein P [Salirhabdus salicampi]|uniref:stage II sporulation protein P n=1 Tax=Salirhabdus salicampi TaxID=476102 RepID=UPI0020C3CCA7|nr:stage II sporulation protein P [Salirhabdus salicampi]MCP8616920.1 stage II sporulation protein P [Salirhabdus salicampi]
MPKRKRDEVFKCVKQIYQGLLFLIVSIAILFLFIGLLTSMNPSYRLSSAEVSNWTNDVNGSSFLYFFHFENRLYEHALPDDVEEIKLSPILFQTAINVKPDDSRSLLGRELPGFEFFDSEIIVAGEGTDYTNLPIESAPPPEALQEEPEANVGMEEEPAPPSAPNNDEQPDLTTEGRNVVLVYSTHNRESFLPHLPEGTAANAAMHSEVNITLVNERFASSLKNYGIGAIHDDTDIYDILLENSWTYGDSYRASRPVVQNALKSNEHLQFIFDFHRDAQPRAKTTKEINGENYGRIFFVIGAEHEQYEENLKLATELHERLDEKYPGISRGVITKKGVGVDGKYNQDLSTRAILVEMGGVENHLSEVYRTADVFAEVFSEYYWQAERVDG